MLARRLAPGCVASVTTERIPGAIALRSTPHLVAHSDEEAIVARVVIACLVLFALALDVVARL
jgi:hypothetical protein